MRFGVFASLLFHLAVVGVAFISLPAGWRPDVAPEPYIPLELIAEADLDLTTSVPAAHPEPEPEIEEPEPELPAPEIEEPPVLTEEPDPEPVVEEPEPEPEPLAPEPDPDPEPPKQAPVVKPPKPENKDLDLDALSALVDKAKEEEQPAPQKAPSETAEAADRARAAIGAGDRLTASDEAKMRAAVERCWNASAIIGAPEPEKLVVVVDFELNRDGSLASAPRVANAMQINLSGNRFWRVAEQTALRAVVACAPYDFLPQERYQTWKEFKLNFDPSHMVGR